MSVFVVETYVVKQNKQAEFASFWKRFLECKEKNPDTFKEVKSFKAFTQVFGGVSGAHVDMWEYKSLADAEKASARMSENKEFMKLQREFALLIDPAAYTTNVWNSVV